MLLTRPNSRFFHAPIVVIAPSPDSSASSSSSLVIPIHEPLNTISVMSPHITVSAALSAHDRHPPPLPPELKLLFLLIEDSARFASPIESRFAPPIES
jgi:hypothetical protein